MPPVEEALLPLVALIVSAQVSNSAMTADELPALIRTVYAALSSAGTLAVPEEVSPERLQPAVPVKKSVFPDYIVCLEDGRKLKTLKRHLRTAYNLTPAQYRERWGLPDTYPMVAPNYAQHRSSLAKSAGLGRKSEAPESTGGSNNDIGVDTAQPIVQRVPEGVSGRKRAKTLQAA